MDRQSLLEKKRQRLQELKQRRLGSSSEDVKIDQLLEKLASPTRGPSISVGVQVEWKNGHIMESKVGVVTPVTTLKEEKECVTYDKAIQAVQQDFSAEKTDVEGDQEVEKDPKSAGIPVVVSIDEEELNAVLKESIKQVHKVQLRELETDETDYTKKIDYFSQSGKSVSFNIGPHAITSNIPQVQGRAVACIDYSPHFPELFVVAYAPNNTTRECPGLAVIYSNKDSRVFPEFFLNCTSSITTIKFDQFTSNNVIGGLSDGKIVIWNLQKTKSNEVAILPSLATPLFSNMTSSSIKSSSGIDFHHHTLAITTILQLVIDGNDSLVSFSLDGTINTWSTNLLALPSSDSVVLSHPKSSNDFTNIKDVLRVRKAVLINEIETHSTINSKVSEHQILSNVLVASDNGLVIQLSGNRKQEYLEFIHSEEKDDSDSFNFAAIINDLRILPDVNKASYFITANMDWTLKIWATASKSPIIVIPTNTIIIKISPRPGKDFQFISLGLMKSADGQKSVIELWDLKFRLFKPVLEIPIDKEKFATNIQFSLDGSKLTAGFFDGSITTWPIEDELLHKFIEAQTKDGIDEGILHYL